MNTDRVLFSVKLQPHRVRPLQTEEKHHYRYHKGNCTPDELSILRVLIADANRWKMSVTRIDIVSDTYYDDDEHIYIQFENPPDIYGGPTDELRFGSVEEAMENAQQYWGVSPDEWEKR